MNFKARRDHFKETLKDYLSFSTSERRGLYVVILLLLITLIVNFSIKHWPHNSNPTDFTQFDKEVNAFLTSSMPDRDSNMLTVQKNVKPVANAKKQEAELFNFNPNGLPESDWKHLGFSEKQIRVIKNYEAKGGKFYTKEDVKKMYSISETEYRRIEPYITIPKQEKVFTATQSKKPPYDELLIDINIADTTELIKLRGIGHAFANRIVKYRTKLGGFHSVNQLHEVWGLSDSLFDAIAGHIYIADTNNLVRININKATFNDLKSHPYFNYNLINVILSYRKEHGDFKLLTDIRRIPLVNEDIYCKIAPYLKVGD